MCVDGQGRTKNVNVDKKDTKEDEQGTSVQRYVRNVGVSSGDTSSSQASAAFNKTSATACRRAGT